MPPKAPLAGTIPKKPESIAPNQTLYIRGLPSTKIQKEDLRAALYLLFSTYGPVLDVVALKTMKMRGQAHIVFRDIQTATQAMRALDGFNFLGEEIKVSYAKSKSAIFSKLDGSFKLPATATTQDPELTDVQRSIFNAPVPGSAPTAANPAASGLPARPQATLANTEPESRGQKRPREEEDDDEDSDVAMEEDSDDD